MSLSLLYTFHSLANFPSQVLPFVIPLTYFLLLPRPDVFSSLVISDAEEAVPSSEYTQLPVSEEDEGEAVVETAPLKAKTLTMSDKWELLKPMLPRYMAPLCMCPLLLRESRKYSRHGMHSFRIPSKLSYSFA
jgi:battenin